MALAVATLLAGCSREPPPAEAPIAKKVSEDFLAEIRSGKVDAAWQSTTSEFKSDEGREQFARFVRDRPALRGPLEFQEHRVTKLNGLNRAECVYHAAKKTGATMPGVAVRIAVGQEQGQWKVEGLFLEDAP